MGTSVPIAALGKIGWTTPKCGSKSNPQCHLLHRRSRLCVADVAPRLSEVENRLSLLQGMAIGRHLGENPCPVRAMGARGSRTSSRAQCSEYGFSIRENGTPAAIAIGFDGGKRIKGRKRHLMVDTLGLVMMVVVTAAN